MYLSCGYWLCSLQHCFTWCICILVSCFATTNWPTFVVQFTFMLFINVILNSKVMEVVSEVKLECFVVSSQTLRLRTHFISQIVFLHCESRLLRPYGSHEHSLANILSPVVLRERSLANVHSSIALREHCSLDCGILAPTQVLVM